MFAQNEDMYHYEFHLHQVEDGELPSSIELRVSDSRGEHHSFPITLQASEYTVRSFKTAEVSFSFRDLNSRLFHPISAT